MVSDKVSYCNTNPNFATFKTVDMISPITDHYMNLFSWLDASQ